jgi:phosphocarrier protein
LKAEADCVIRNELGLHLRAAAAFVKMADRFESDVMLMRGDQEANGKSIIALAALGAWKGTELRIVAQGADARDAVAALAGLVEEGFGEMP